MTRRGCRQGCGSGADRNRGGNLGGAEDHFAATTKPRMIASMSEDCSTA